MRTVLGASCGRVIGQLFVEVLVLGAIAAVLRPGSPRGLALYWIEGDIDADEFVFLITFTLSYKTATAPRR